MKNHLLSIFTLVILILFQIKLFSQMPGVQNTYNIRKTSKGPSDLLVGVNDIQHIRTVYLHTDRTDYSTGESIFFKAYVISDKSNRYNPLTDSLYVALIDQDGLEVASEKFSVKKFGTAGNIRLSEFLTEGNYALIASTSQMKNSSPDRIFSKIIEVKKSKPSGIRIELSLKDTLYKPGSLLTADIRFFGKNDNPVAPSFTYRLQDTKGEIYSGKEKAKEDGRAIVAIPLPAFQREQVRQYGYSADRNISDIIKQIKPYQLVGGKIMFANNGINSINFQDGALIVIDGIKMGTDAGILNSIPVTDIAKINVFTNPSDIQRYTGLNSAGIIEIVMKKGPESIEKEEPVPEIKSSALLWAPDIETNSTGNAAISFFTNKSSEVLISVEGITDNGLPGSSMIKFSVK